MASGINMHAAGVAVPDILPSASPLSKVPRKHRRLLEALGRGEKAGGGDWKWGAIAVLGATTIATAGLLVSQWHYAVIGRTVSCDVVRFLEHTGSTRNHGTIQGGAINVPMTVGKAVVVTVSRALGIVNAIIDEDRKKRDRKKRAVPAEVDEGAEDQSPQSPSSSSTVPEKPRDPPPLAGLPGQMAPKINTPLFEPEDTRAAEAPATTLKIEPYNGDEQVRMKQKQTAMMIAQRKAEEGAAGEEAEAEDSEGERPGAMSGGLLRV